VGFVEDDAQRFREDKESQLAAARERICALTEKCTITEERFAQARWRSEELQGLIAEKQQAYNEMMEECREGGLRVAEMRRLRDQQQRQSQVSRCIEEFRQRSNLSGIHGRLGSLGRVDSQYTTAVSVAGGRKLDFIVVDNAEIAQACLGEVKRCQAGWATFILLSQAPTQAPVIERMPEGARLLIDTIECEPRFGPAFWMVFQDTLVTADLDTARRVALHSERRYRAVTLNGEVVDKSGTMSGGGNTSQRRTGINVVSDNDFDEAVAESGRLDAEAKGRKEELEVLRQELRQLRADDLEGELRRAQMDLDRFTQQSQLLDGQLSQLSDFVADPKDLERIEELRVFLSTDHDGYSHLDILEVVRKVGAISMDVGQMAEVSAPLAVPSLLVLLAVIA
jgi:structural maintenance of chromosome 4